MNIKVPDSNLFRNNNSLFNSTKYSLVFRKKSKTEKDKRAEEILSKFNAGKKLTAEELQYLSIHAPEAYERVKRIMAEREQLERQIKLAETKQQSALPPLPMIGNIEISGTDGSEMSARMNQFRDAINNYMKTMDYYLKPDTMTDLIETLNKSQDTNQTSTEDILSTEEVPTDEEDKKIIRISKNQIMT